MAALEGDEPLRLIYGVWFRGFVSGYNFGNSANQVALDKMPDPASVSLYVDKYCRRTEAPLHWRGHSPDPGNSRIPSRHPGAEVTPACCTAQSFLD